MGKLVVLIAGEGSFEQGFPVTLRLGEEGKNPDLEITGRLPPAPELAQAYSSWAIAYRALGLPSRLEAAVTQVTNISKRESCLSAAQVLRDRLNTWLYAESFRPIREKLLEQLVPSEAIRLVIQTEDRGLRRLPWHLWDLCDRYPHAEIALSTLIYERVPLTPPTPKVRILAILGNSTGIDTQADRRLLEALPNAQVTFLVEPQRQALTAALWQQGWDILFFAGHSSSLADGETGQIYLNQTDSLTIDQLRYALRNAVAQGLKIAIFNSCEGLGLARRLAHLQIPQVVVMREPVPDQVCQEFLKSFLAAFSQGKSFYLAVREARERLQGLEDQFPCATWLPVICQNPAVTPPAWRELWQGSRGASDPQLSPSPRPPIPQSPRASLRTVFLLSLVITALTLVVRQLGILQPLELRAFDQLMRLRPAQAPDSRLVIVEVTESDMQAQGQEPRRGSLSDRSLARLLETLESYQPRVIGLDIYRDFPATGAERDLITRLKTSDRLVAVCKVSNPETNDQGISPPPEVPADRHGFSDVITDPDGVLRRQLLALTPSPASPCAASYALSSQVAFRYLAAEGISPQYTADGYLQLGKTIIRPLESNTGGYQGIDAWGHQVLLNYRAYRSPQHFAARVTLTQVLQGQLNPEALKDRVVLIGVTAPSAKDYFLTPYSTSQQLDQHLPGVIAQGQMVSQILSAVLDGRSLLWTWSQPGEVLWIWGWALIGGLLTVRASGLLRWGLLGVALSLVSGLCFGLLLQGGWVPLIPAVLALVATSGSAIAYQRHPTRRQSSTLALES